MIHSEIRKKNTNSNQEDPKTSFFFEMLLMLPDDLFWKVIKSATDCAENPGRLIDYKFWPKWDVTDIPEINTNDKFVEPDIFIQFENCDVIIEAKRGESGQYKGQWDKELTAYYYSQEKIKRQVKKIVFIAIGGNSGKTENQANDIRKGATAYCPVHKTSWIKLLHSAKSIDSDNNDKPQIKRLIELFEYGSNKLFHVRDFKWFDSLKNKDFELGIEFKMKDFEPLVDSFAKGLYDKNNKKYGRNQ